MKLPLGPKPDPENLIQQSRFCLKEAQRLIGEGKSVLAAIALHDHCEYLLKYRICKMTGKLPDTHSIRGLLHLLKDNSPIMEHLVANRKNFFNLVKIERAYIYPKLFTSHFDLEQLKPLLQFTQEVFDRALGEISIN